MVMESHYMESLERKPEADKSMDAMTREDYERQIQELRESNKNLNSIISTMKLTMESLRASNDRNTAQMETMQKLIENLTSELKKYQDYNGRNNQSRFGKTSLKKRRTVDVKQDRQQESEDYDNGHGSLS